MSCSCTQLPFPFLHSLESKRQDSAVDAALSSLLTRRCQQWAPQVLRACGHSGHTQQNQNFGYFFRAASRCWSFERDSWEISAWNCLEVLDNLLSFHMTSGKFSAFLVSAIKYTKRKSGCLLPEVPRFIHRKQVFQISEKKLPTSGTPINAANMLGRDSTSSYY